MPPSPLTRKIIKTASASATIETMPIFNWAQASERVRGI
jgi:hypothetical protein